MSEESIPAPVPADDHVRGVRLPVRLFATPAVHRLLPAPIALALVARFGSPGAGEGRTSDLVKAERSMRDLLLHTPRAAQAQELARKNVAEVARLRELFWRPWLFRRTKMEGIEHWEAAHQDGRGCLVVVGHFGGLFGLSPALARHGLRLYSVASSHYWEPMPDGYEGLVTLRLRAYAEAFGPGTAIPNTVAPERLTEILDEGKTLLIAFDVPGSAATPFLGRSVALTGVPATAAHRTGAMVLPMLPVRRGSRLVVRIFEPLDPRDYPDPAALRAAIARVFEHLVLESPEIVDYSWYPSPLVTEVPGQA